MKQGDGIGNSIMEPIIQIWSNNSANWGAERKGQTRAIQFGSDFKRVDTMLQGRGKNKKGKGFPKPRYKSVKRERDQDSTTKKEGER